MRVLSNADVNDLLPMDAAIGIVDQTMRAVSAGAVTMPLRNVMPVGGGNMLGVMPGAVAESGAFGVKLVSLFPNNPAAGHSSHQGAMVLFEATHGAAVAMMNADRLTALRTAAASAVATRALARQDATRLTLIGTGEQAETHLTAMCAVRAITDVTVLGRAPDRAAGFVDRMRAVHPDLGFHVATEGAHACAQADIICTVTSSPTPVLMADWVRPGTHVNAVGASIPTKQEIDEALTLAARLYTDYRASALAQAAEIILLIEAGQITPTHILGEIGEVLDGTAPGRTGPSDITLYRSLGVIAQDIACARHVLDRATDLGRGQVVMLE